MTEKETEEKIRRAFSHAAPDELDRILAACTPYNSGVSRSAAKVLPAGSARIILDVNPSILLQVDEEETVTQAEALNEDGKKILAGLHLDGTPLSSAMEALVEALVSAGYVSEAQNSVLVSVADEDAEKETALQEKVSRIIADAVREDLAGSGTGASVIAQPFNERDEEAARLAAAYGISPGKAALILRMISKEGASMEEQSETQQKNTRQQFEDLAGASVNDIALLADEKPIKDETVTRIGRASEMAYIGHKGALEAALTYAGITMQQVRKQKVKIGRRKGRMIYKVKIKSHGRKYKYELDGRTGRMVRCKKNGGKKKPLRKYYKKLGKKQKRTYIAGGKMIMAATNNDPYNANAQVPVPEGAISEQAAKEAALNHAGVKESDTQYVYVHPEVDHGRVEHYDVKFTAGGMKYKYAIGLYDGAVLGRAVKDKVHKGKYVYEGNYHEHVGAPMGMVSQTAPVSGGAAPAAADEAPAADAAPARAAAPAAPAQAAAPAAPAAAQDTGTGDMLSEGDALDIALDHAGLTIENLIRWKIKLCTKHGRTVYRVKLKVPGYEYEIDVDAYSQSVTKAHKEIDF